MRVTREKAAENREKIVAAAARLFREKGFDGVGLDAIMAAAGLTHGGFYRHFRSKDALAAAAVVHAGERATERLGGVTSLSELVSTYLSPRHREDRSGGCMVAALGGDAARQDNGVRRALTTYVRARFARLASLIGRGSAASRRQQAIALFAGIVGAMVLARAVEDPALSDEILAAANAVYGGAAAATPADPR